MQVKERHYENACVLGSLIIDVFVRCRQVRGWRSGEGERGLRRINTTFLPYNCSVLQEDPPRYSKETLCFKIKATSVRCPFSVGNGVCVLGSDEDLYERLFQRMRGWGVGKERGISGIISRTHTISS